MRIDKTPAGALIRPKWSSQGHLSKTRPPNFSSNWQFSDTNGLFLSFYSSSPPLFITQSKVRPLGVASFMQQLIEIEETGPSFCSDNLQRVGWAMV